MRKFLRSFAYGFAGLAYVARTEVNMRWHLLAAVAVIAAGAYFEISMLEWAIVVVVIGVMLALESVNTAIERLADRVTDEQDPLIGHAKDAAAGAVLVMSVASAVVGFVIFWPKFVAMMQ
jgi:undecaprenol kinase